MKSGCPYNQDTADFIFTWTGNQPRLATYVLGIGVSGMVMAHGYDLRSLFTQRITQGWGIRISYNRSLPAPNPEARMS
jgi:hypothetical protein